MRQLRTGAESGQDLTIQGYLTNLLKLIPSEIIALYMMLVGIIPNSLWPMVGISAACVILTPIYLIGIMKVTKWTQVVVSTVAIVVWMFSLSGGVFTFIPGFKFEPWMATLAIVIWTTLPPLIFEGKSLIPSKEGT
jgi:hypothetical protein